MSKFNNAKTILIGVAIVLFGIATFSTPIDLTRAPWASALLVVAGLLVMASTLVGRRRDH